MNEMISRRFLSEILIMLAVCVGAWMLVVSPKLGEIHELEVIIAEVKSNPALMSQRSIERLATEIQTVRADVRRIKERNALGSDSTTMYRTLRDRARDAGVVVQRLDPGGVHEITDGETPVRVTAFEIVVDGTYREVADFLAAIDAVDGFVRPTQLRISPRPTKDGRKLVTAHFSCESVSFTVPEALTAMLGGNDAHQ